MRHLNHIFRRRTTSLSQKPSLLLGILSTPYSESCMDAPARLYSPNSHSALSLNLPIFRTLPLLAPHPTTRSTDLSSRGPALCF
jgi:hypothetical protein